MTTYAISFDLDVEELRQNYPSLSYTNACGDVSRVLESIGFSWQHGNLYVGNANVNAVTCVTAAQKLSAEYLWFKNSVRDIRMMRIEEISDLKPAL